MPSPAELLKMADETAAQIDEMERLLPVLREQEAALRKAAAAQAAAGIGKVGSRLRLGTEKGTLGTEEMEAQTASRGASVSAAKTKNRLPFPRALHKRNLSPPEWARAQRKPKVEVESVKSWLKKPGRGGRPCPRFWADRIAAEFVDEKGRTEVPAVDESWPSGIRETP